MMHVLLGDRSRPLDVNSRRSLVAIVYLAVIGPCVFIVQPGFVQGLVESVGLTEQQAGYIASAEVFGIAATTILLSLIAAKISWRIFLSGCVALGVAANLLSMNQTDFEALAVLRFAAGLCSGGLISLTFTMMGISARPDRNFGLIIVWVLTYGGIGLLVMPTAYGLVGMNGVLVFFALFHLTGLAFIRSVPDSGRAEETAATPDFHPTTRRLSLLAILIYNIAIGIVWAYLFLVGLETGMDEQAVANALTVSQFLGVGGAFFSVLFETRLGRLWPLVLSIIGTGVATWLLTGGAAPLEFWVAVCGFNLLWNLSMPYLLGSLSDYDASGHTVVHGVSMQMLGLAIGPFVAARILGMGGYDAVNLTAVVLFGAALLVKLPGLVAQRVHHIARNAQPSAVGIPDPGP
ncbi:MAG: MFS transporter, partial [Pseudomonadota bacterium]